MDVDVETTQHVAGGVTGQSGNLARSKDRLGCVG